MQRITTRSWYLLNVHNHFIKISYPCFEINHGSSLNQNFADIDVAIVSRYVKSREATLKRKSCTGKVISISRNNPMSQFMLAAFYFIVYYSGIFLTRLQKKEPPKK